MNPEDLRRELRHSDDSSMRFRRAIAGVSVAGMA